MQQPVVLLVAHGRGRGGGGGGRRPPWIEGGARSPWRLPDCVISDIRMPGGIDGVRLPELLGRNPPAAGEKVEKVAELRRRRGARRVDAGDAYNERDDFELLDAIGGWGERIMTPTDQTVQCLDAIRGCIEFCRRDGSVKGQGTG